MRNLIFVFCALLPVGVFAENRLVVLSSDKAAYQIGEKAVLSARLTTKPDNQNLEFDLVGSIDGTEIPIQRVTDFDFYSTTAFTAIGQKKWRITVYIQDARVARDLKISIASFIARISEIDLLLQTETDPAKRDQLLQEKARTQQFLAASEAQLISIRSKIYGPVQLNLQVN